MFRVIAFAAHVSDVAHGALVYIVLTSRYLKQRHIKTVVFIVLVIDKLGYTFLMFNIICRNKRWHNFKCHIWSIRCHQFYIYDTDADSNTPQSVSTVSTDAADNTLHIILLIVSIIVGLIIEAYVHVSVVVENITSY